MWYSEPSANSNAIGYAMHRSRAHDALIRVYDGAGNVIETQEYWLRLRACRNSDHIRLRTGAAAVVGTHTVVISRICTQPSDIDGGHVTDIRIVIAVDEAAAAKRAGCGYIQPVT